MMENTNLKRKARSKKEQMTHQLLKSNSIQAKIWKYLINRDVTGATDEEIQTALEVSPNTLRPRRSLLVRKGFVKYSGREKRNTSGSKAKVWVAVVPKYEVRKEGE